ncbi:hypothetical protein QUB69_36325, partial [Microcoleus sp. AT13-A6]|uniref:hypothetical protein n=2 Tax=unclassified Microcoleus TaxID=2642155 RepID=UPI002FD333C9
DRLQEVMLYFDFLFHLACYLAPLRDRFLKDKGRSLLYQLSITAMTTLRISLPVYSKNWQTLSEYEDDDEEVEVDPIPFDSQRSSHEF